jgi:beta-glucanase (GH16 family)
MEKIKKLIRSSSGVIAALLVLIPISGLTADFDDTMDAFDSVRWMKADNWANGGMFNVGWKADHLYLAGGVMTLRLDNVPSSGKPFSSGALLSNALYGYGKIEGVMKAGKGNGIVSSLFIYNGNPWDEIDVEILGKDTTAMQTNYFTNGVGHHETVVPLGFDSSAAFHTYTIIWMPGKIQWYVDGHLKVTESGTRGALPTHPGKIMANLWPGIGVDGWTNHFNYSSPIYAQYDRISYSVMRKIPIPLVPSILRSTK